MQAKGSDCVAKHFAQLNASKRVCPVRAVVVVVTLVLLVHLHPARQAGHRGQLTACMPISEKALGWQGWPWLGWRGWLSLRRGIEGARPCGGGVATSQITQPTQRGRLIASLGHFLLQLGAFIFLLPDLPVRGQHALHGAWKPAA